MMAPAQTQMRSWNVHDVHFLNQLPALLEVLKVHIQDLEEQLLTLENRRTFDETQAPQYSQAQLQAIQKQHQNRLRYYQELQTAVNQWHQQAQYSYQRVHCEFIDATLKDIIELCEKIVDVAEDMESAFPLKTSDKRDLSLSFPQQSSNQPPESLQPENTPVFSSQSTSDIGLATIANDIEDIGGLMFNLFNKNANTQPKPNEAQEQPLTEKTKKFSLQAWLNLGPEDYGMWLRM